MEVTADRKSNHGPNVKRWREWRGIKQDELAEKVGISQGTLSMYENREKLEPEIVKKIAKALDIPTEAITEINEGTSIYIFTSTLNDNSSVGNAVNHYNNPLDKVTELYERLLKSEQEKVTILQEIVKEKK